MRWFKRKIPDLVPSEPWEPERLPLEGDYPDAEIVESSVHAWKHSRAPTCKIKLRLLPDDPSDEATAWAYINQLQFMRLLHVLDIPRTRDVRVLIGKRVEVEVRLRSNPFGFPSFTQAIIPAAVEPLTNAE